MVLWHFVRVILKSKNWNYVYSISVLHYVTFSVQQAVAAVVVVVVFVFVAGVVVV
jgi:hypothetical protein